MQNKPFKEPSEALGEYVVLKTIDINDNTIQMGLYIPQKAVANNKLATYEVMSVGKDAYEKYGLEVGMIVSADRLACYGWREAYPIIKYESVIFQQIDDKIYPMKGQIIVEPIKDIQENGLMPAKRSNIGKIVATNTSKKLDVGDTVLLTEGADYINLNGRDYFIYKEDMIIAKYYI